MSTTWARIEKGRVAGLTFQSAMPTIAGTWVEASGRALGDAWNGSAFSAGSGTAAFEQADPRLWWITPAAFWERLGDDGQALLVSSDEICRAVVALIDRRRDFVDLKEEKVSSLLGMLITNTLPAANATFGSSGPMTTGKRTTILTTATTDAERYVKGLVAPA